VVLVDSEFKIERPKRYYRQGLHLLHLDGLSRGDEEARKEMDHDGGINGNDDRAATVREQNRSKHQRDNFLTKFLSLPSRQHHHPHQADTDTHEPTAHDPQLSPPSSPSGTSLASEDFAPHQTIDPSTGMDPKDNKVPTKGEDGKKKKEGKKDLSLHTFYISNSERRIRMVPRSEVCFFLIVIVRGGSRG
jgi:phospholipase D1/2